jgi:hypothetical protein
MGDSSGSKTNVALINNLVEASFEVLLYHHTLREIQLQGACCYAIRNKTQSFVFFKPMGLYNVILLLIFAFFRAVFGFSFTFFSNDNSILRL